MSQRHDRDYPRDGRYRRGDRGDRNERSDRDRYAHSSSSHRPRDRSASPTRRDRRDYYRDRESARDRHHRDAYDDREDRRRQREHEGAEDRRREGSREADFTSSRKTASVRESQDGHRRQEAAKEDPILPTRSKGDRTTTPLSFRVGKGKEEARESRSHKSGSDTPIDRGHRPDTEETAETDEHMSEGDVDQEPVEEPEIEQDDGMAAMAAMMGFKEFGTTHGKQVKGNHRGAARVEKKTEYRQYMNRRGGFNRPLSPGR